MAKCSCGLVVAITFAVLGLLVLIAGAVIPFVIRMVMDDAVKKAIITNFDKMSADTKAKYIDGDLNYRFFLWNITNLDLALNNGDKIRVEEVGPYTYIKYQHKYNITFASDGSTISYFTWDKWVPQFVGANPLTDRITTVNPVYPNAIASTSSPIPLPVYYTGDDGHEEKLLLQFTAGAFAKGIKDTFTNETGALLSAFRVLSISSIMQAWFQLFQLAAGTNPTTVGATFPSAAAIAAQWANPKNTTYDCDFLGTPFTYEGATGRCVMSAGFLSLAGNCGGLSGSIELSGLASLDPVDIGRIFNVSNAEVGVFTVSGLFNWATVIQTFAAGGGVVFPATTLLHPETAIPMVGAWFSQFSPPTNDNYRLCVASLLRSRNNPGLPATATWSEFGIFQFQTGNLTRAALGVGSVKQLPPALASLLPFPLPAAPEAGAYVNPYTGQLWNLTFADATFVLDTFADVTALATWYLTAAGDSILGNNNCERGAAYEPVCAGMRSYARFIANAFVLQAPSPLGLIVNNTGLFTVRSPQEILFGFQDDFLKAAGVVPPVFPGFFGPNSTTQDFDWQFNQFPTAPDVEYTGQTDIDKLGQYQKYEGCRNATLINDFPATNGGSRRCLTTDQTIILPVPIRFGYEEKCHLWTKPEIIDGQYIPTQFKPFDEGDGTPFYDLWVKEVRRAVRLVKQATQIKFKGITMNRYFVDQTQLLRASQNPANVKYTMTVDNGIVPMTRYFGGADLFVSQPHFLGGNLTAIKSHLDPTSTINPVDTIDMHKTYLDIEPYSGKTMAARKRLQLGVMISTARYTTDGAYGKIVQNFTDIHSPLYVPILWAEEGKDISDEDASDFVSKIYDTRAMLDKVMIGGIAGGGAFGIIMVFVACRVSKRSSGGAQSKSTGRLSEDYMGGTTL